MSRASKKPTTNDAVTTPTVRCAIYTRKSSEEGLEQEFNSLDAQREAGEAFIRSQLQEGWQLSPERYDDGGFTGGNMDRPALQRLMADIDAGTVNCVVVYKVDRLSRSLLDFARMMESFEANKVAFVSVTQQFNTASSMGRLVLNVLLSFAQFEREIISERTRDKIAATRRKGKWTGGQPILGYDVDPRCTRLVVNEPEAERVRAIFDLYLEHQALLPVVQHLAAHDLRNKAWTTRKGITKGGQGFTKTSLHQLLTNVIYAGKIRYKDEVHPGVHAGIIDPEVWQRVQDRLATNNRTGGRRQPNRFGAILMGLLRCSVCQCAMTPTTSSRSERTYRYYTCTSAIQRGRSTCPSPSLPAGEVERYVLAQIESPVLQDTVTEESRMYHTSVQPVWKTLTPNQQAQALGHLIEQIDYDATKGTMAIRFQPTGFTSFLDEFAHRTEMPCPR